MRAVIFTLCLSLFSLSSCQGGKDFILDWFDYWKEQSLTHLASQTDSSFSEDIKIELLFLFEDLLYSKGCDEFQSHIENNPALIRIEESLDLNRGFLFDVFINDYDYGLSLFQQSRTAEERAAFSIVSVWKSEFSFKNIEEVADRSIRCYPNEYF